MVDRDQLAGMREASKILRKKKRKELWSLVGTVATVIVIVWIILGALFGERKPEIHEGEPCGEGHHWKWVGIGQITDLSCERD
jgi:hypothetical protein